MTIYDVPRGIPTEQATFREWLGTIDRDGDGRISKQELREALRALGHWCIRWKAWRAMMHAYLNRNDFIDGDAEIDEFINYAAKRGFFVPK